jgi:hypothetical protein
MTSPVKLGERCAAWPAHEITTINTARIAGKTDKEIRELVTRLEQQRTAPHSRHPNAEFGSTVAYTTHAPLTAGEKHNG